IEVYLAYSRDCMKWELVSEEPVIPLGKEGEWDSGMITTANQPLFKEDGNVLIYYSGANFSHGHGEIDMPYEKDDSMCIGISEMEFA
ncbi:MAG: hypothetical protein NZ526_05410, partial [Aquificaceae bacterium]|nr:hypothetical protein [Aquificaceae bacterium]